MSGGLCLVVLVWLVAGLSPVQANQCPTDREGTARVSLDAVNMGLKRALDEISRQVNQEISTRGVDGERLVTGKFDCVPLDQVLSKLFRGVNIITLTWPNRMEIRGLGGRLQAWEHENRESRVLPLERLAGDRHPPSIFPDQPGSIPPVEEGGDGLTDADVRYYLQAEESQGVVDFAVIPAVAGAPVLTFDELELMDSYESLPASEMPVVPAQGDKPELMLEELEKIIERRRASDLSGLEVIPPGQGEVRGYTDRNLESMIVVSQPYQSESEQVPPN